MNSPDQKNLLDNQPYKIYEFKKSNQENISGYFVVSTAKLNVETEEHNSNGYLSEVTNKRFFNINDGYAEPSAKQMIQKIAKSLQSSSEPEIIINIHGYSSTPSDTEIGCKKIYEYVNSHIQQPNKYIFIGYRWPSENPTQTDESGSFGQKLINAFSSLPTLLAINLLLGLTISIWSAIALLFLNILSNSAVHFFTALLILSGIVSSIIFTLIILRISTYFRDTYRDPQGVDTHTGYFEGDFSQKAIYELAFLGFQGFLLSLSIEGNESDKISVFSQRCHEKQIQVILSPQIYQQKTQD